MEDVLMAEARQAGPILRVSCFKCGTQTGDADAQGRTYIYCRDCRSASKQEKVAEQRWAEIERMDWPDIIGE